MDHDIETNTLRQWPAYPGFQSGRCFRSDTISFFFLGGGWGGGGGGGGGGCSTLEPNMKSGACHAKIGPGGPLFACQRWSGLPKVVRVLTDGIS